MVFGMCQVSNVVDLPDGVVGYKIKQRLQEFATIALRYKDGAELRYLERVEDGTFRPGDGVIAVNRRS